MSGAYLQRLFDRAAAPAAPLVTPGGPSRSPVAEADQRLNEPGLAEQFSFAPQPDVRPLESFDEAIGETGPPSPRPPSTAPQTPARSRSSPEAPPPVTPPLVRDRGEPADRPLQPAPFDPVGMVAPDEFVPPEAAGPRPASAASPAPPERGASPEAAAAPPAERVVEVRTIETTAPPPSELRADVPAVARAEPAEVVDRPPSAAAEPAPWPEPPQLQRPVMVTPPRPESRPVPPAEPDAAPAAETRAAEPSARLRETVREVIRAEAAAQQKPAPRRPMTAAEASLIGQLTPEPRARTLFGLRRR